MPDINRQDIKIFCVDCSMACMILSQVGTVVEFKFVDFEFCIICACRAKEVMLF